ncbi:hypothetical protein EYR40_006414 [Pleurotus pulmonarius]|nr:hypothetical protein EYR40_006414 [Pleurotus pulmonarius]
MLDPNLILSSTVFTLIAVLYLRQRFSKRGTEYTWPLPPGPKRLPFIGNLLDMPKHLEWVTFRKWARDLDSDIIHIDLMGNHVIILDSFEAANDLLEKRSSRYSSRTQFTMANELVGWDFNFGFKAYGEDWRQCRKLFHHEFHPVASRRFQPREIKATNQFLRALLETPEDYVEHLRQHFNLSMAGAITLGIAYGLDIKPHDDPYVKLSEQGVHALLTSTIPGAFLVDTLPFLKYVPAWFPGAGFQKKAKEWRELATVMRDMPFQAAKQAFMEGSDGTSFTYSRLAKMNSESDIDLEEKYIKSVAGTMYAAGADSTVSALAFFILAVLHNPAALAKGQEEIDRVVGNDRLPDFGDEESLPYISAIVKEVLRWDSVTPIAIPHLSTTDDVYKGYFIPAGTMIIPNAWSMLHDENHYPDPFTFNPDRFMKDGKLNKGVKDPAAAAFGFGRRICPGRYMAFQSVWIAIASMVATLDIKKAVDGHGNPIEPSGEHVSALVCMPAPFKCSIKPRSASAAALIQSTEKDI